jgi:tetratricopeptide (TPR) repeat protein
MSTFCKIADDPNAQALCQSLEINEKVTLADLDVGVDETRIMKVNDEFLPSMVKGGADGKVDAPEVYRRAIEVAEEKDRQGVPLDFLQGRLQIPWIPMAPMAPMAADASLKKRISSQVQAIRKELSQKGPKEGSLDYDIAFGRKIFDYLRRDADQGGFGLSFDFADSYPRTLADMDKERKATCLDFTNLFLMAARNAGIAAVPLELFRRGNAVQLHLAIGFLNPATQSIHTVIDLQPPGYFGPPKAGDLWAPITRLELLTHYDSARGAREKDAAQGESWIDAALRLSPRHYLPLFNKSYFVAQRGDYQKAKKLLLESIASNPVFVDSYWNLSEVLGAMGDLAGSKEAMEQFKNFQLERLKI